MADWGLDQPRAMARMDRFETALNTISWWSCWEIDPESKGRDGLNRDVHRTGRNYSNGPKRASADRAADNSSWAQSGKFAPDKLGPQPIFGRS